MSIWNREKNNEPPPASEQDKLLEKFSTLVTEALKPIAAKVEEQGNEVKTLATKFTALESGAEKELADAEARRRAEEEGALTPEQREANERKALFAMNVATNARITEDRAAAVLEKEFPKLVSEFRQMCANTAIAVKAQANYEQQCMNAIDGLIGREARKGGLRYQKQTEKFVIEDGGSHGGGEGDPLIGGDYDWMDERSGKTLTGMQQLSKIGLGAKEFADMQKRGIV